MRPTTGSWVATPARSRAGLAGWLDLDEGQRALDVGLRAGRPDRAARRPARRRPRRRRRPVRALRRRCRARLPGVDVRLGTADSLPFDDDTFDVTAACLVVHFMPDPVAGLAEMARVTRPGGWVAATVWDLAGSRAPMWPVWEAFGVKVRPGGLAEEHLPAGTQGELRRMLEAAGIQHVETVEMPVTVTHAELRGVVGALPRGRRADRRGARRARPRRPTARRGPVPRPARRGAVRPHRGGVRRPWPGHLTVAFRGRTVGCAIPRAGVRWCRHDAQPAPPSLPQRGLRLSRPPRCGVWRVPVAPSADRGTAMTHLSNTANRPGRQPDAVRPLHAVRARRRARPHLADQEGRAGAALALHRPA